MVERRKRDYTGHEIKFSSASGIKREFDRERRLVDVMNRAMATDLPAPVRYLPLLPHISATLLIEINLGYVLLSYSLWYLVIYF